MILDRSRIVRVPLCFCAVAAMLLSGCASPVIKAAAAGDKEQMTRLLAGGTDVNAASEGVTPLAAAAAHARNEMIGFLIEKGANPNLQVEGGWSPLLSAIFNKHSDSAKLLVNSGAEVTIEAAEAARSYAPDLNQFFNRALGGHILSQAQLQKAVDKAMAEHAAAKRIVPISDVDKPTYADSEHSDDYAVVVGIEKYADPDLPEAAYADHDAQAVRSHLVALGVPPRNIKFLAGSRATKSQLVAYLEQWLPVSVKPDSRVFFYFSGHGAPASDSHEAYLVPFDGDPDYLPETAYPMKRLYAKLNSLAAKRVIIALDACFSGAGGRSVLPKGTRPLATRVDAWLMGDGHVTALSASRVDQVSGTMDSQGHGIFTYYLLKGLNGAAVLNGHVTMKGLFSYLQPKVGDEASNQNRRQSPQLLPDDVADFGWR